VTLKAAKPVTFIQTKAPDAAVAFYRDVLGISYGGFDGFGHVFEMAGATLRITEIPGWTAGAHPALGWQVGDIAAAVAALKSKGVTLKIYPGIGQGEDGIWVAPGGAAKVCWFEDPDGNLLSLTES
jgi:catechol 2,3-dioxygenase-like lactoylglutathione lyase family enzyme